MQIICKHGDRTVIVHNHNRKSYLPKFGNERFRTIFQIRAVSNSEYLGHVEGCGLFEFGDVVTLTAVPNQYCIFIRWSDGVQTPSRQVNVMENKTYTAIFEQQLGNITYNTD